MAGVYGLKTNESWPNLASSYCDTENQSVKHRSTHRITVPFIRENKYGQSLGTRAASLEYLMPEATPGPPDLIHWGKYYGLKSHRFLNNEFVAEGLERDDKRDDEGYIGYYHYVNGLRFENFEKNIESYVLGVLGMEKENDNYYFTRNPINDALSSSKKDMVVTFCSLNLFDKSDFRARYVIRFTGSMKKLSAHIDKSFQITGSQNSRTDSKSIRSISYNEETIRKVSKTYWDELQASEIIRLFRHLDNPSTRLTNLVSLPDTVFSRESTIMSLRCLIKFLPRGSRTGTPAFYGYPSGSKNGTKTTDYRNFLVSALLRICALDSYGDIGDIAIKFIREQYYNGAYHGEWDYIILQIMKTQPVSSKEGEFLNLIHLHTSMKSFTTHQALLLSEQVKFLISRERPDLALIIAKKCVQILSLDFSCWYNLALCYVMLGEYKKALLVLNGSPVALNLQGGKFDIDFVSGMVDWYSQTFMSRSGHPDGEISEQSFWSYFPEPSVSSSQYSINSKIGHAVDEVPSGSIRRIWKDMFLFNPRLRHPMSGYKFFQSPLVNCSGKELSSVDPSLIRITGNNSIKNILASHSAGVPSTSILEFKSQSTWGRCYDLLSLMAAQVGWDELVRIKENAFRDELSYESVSSKEYVVNHSSNEFPEAVRSAPWMNQLFFTIYEDLKIIMTIRGRENQHHSAIEWELLGIVGWSVKYGIKESIGSLITSVLGKSKDGIFDYFATVQLLEIYDEFVLSEVSGSHLDAYNDIYSNGFYSTKFALKSQAGIAYNDFVKSLETDLLPLDFILLHLLKLISWNLRWYEYNPNYLISKVLIKLSLKHDSVFIRSNMKMIFEQNKKKMSNKRSKYSMGSLLGYSGNSKTQIDEFEFVESDTILLYFEKLMTWIEGGYLKTS